LPVNRFIHAHALTHVCSIAQICKRRDESAEKATYRCLRRSLCRPLPPEYLEKVIREVPRNRETVDLFNELSGADPLPQP
jgi:hypothetical protein